MENCTENKKRVRDEFEDDDVDSLADSAESKLRRLDSSDFRSVKPCGTTEKANWNNVVDSDAAGIDLADSEGINRDELLLDILEDSDSVVTERDGSIQGLELDSFIRSFEEEILPARTPPDLNHETPPPPPPQAELGYLFEASDDELGLPPTGGSSTEGKMEANDFMPAAWCSPGLFDLGGNLGFDDEIPCYDSFEIGIGIDSGAAEEFVAWGSLFDYSDLPFRAESLSAL